MSDPFLIEGPALVSFSGGRTSALMLRRILDRGLQPDVHVVFANTGKEREETLEFVQACAERWGVEIAWVEFRDVEGARTTETFFDAASRHGEPFEALIRSRGFLPNPTSRWCTQELKIRRMRDFMTSRGYEHWTNVIGIRADEPHRVARQKAANAAGKERWENAMPLAEAGVTLADVTAFWKAQPFDLGLNPWEGNCDLCFLKGRKKIERIMADRPELAEWWVGMEDAVKETARNGAGTFRSDRPPYSALREMTRRQLPLALEVPACDLDDLGDCVCTD